MLPNTERISHYIWYARDVCVCKTLQMISGLLLLDVSYLLRETSACMRFILREVTSNQPHPSSNDTAYYYAEYQPAANTAPLKKGFHSLEWVIVITNPPRYGYKRLTRCTVFQAGADKSHRSLTFSRIQFKPSEEQARSSRKPNYSRKLQTK